MNRAKEMRADIALANERIERMEEREV